MNPDLVKALGEIERGAEQCLQARQVEFQQMQKEIGNKQVIVGHIDKQEEPDIEVMENMQAEKGKVMADIQVEKEKVTEDVQVEKSDRAG